MDQAEIKRLQGIAAASGAQRVASTPKSKPKSNAPGFTAFLSELSGAGGAMGGAALGASVGSVVPGVGTVIGGLLGGALGGFGGGTLGKLAENKGRDNEFRVSEALGEGAMSGIFGAGPIKLAKAATGAGNVLLKGGTKTAAREGAESALAKKLFTKTATEGAGEVTKKGLRGRVAGKLEDVGGRMLNSQTNLTRAEIRKLDVNAPKLFTEMQKKYGISNLDEMAKIAPKVTGETGIYSEAVRNALGNSKGIDTSDLKLLFEQSLTSKAPLVTGATKKNLQEQLNNNIQKMYSAQPLNPKANPLDAFDVAKNYRAQAQQLKTGATVSSTDKQIASVYDDMANALEKRLYSAEGVAESLPLLKGEIATKFKQEAAKVGTKTREGKALLKMANEAENIKTVANLRSIQKPWVLASKVEEGTARAAGNAAARLGGGGGIVARVTNPVLDAVTPTVGANLTRAGNVIAGNPASGASQLPAGLGMLGRVGAASNINSALNPSAVEPEQPVDETLDPTTGLPLGTGMDMMDGTQEMLSQPEQIKQGLQAAAMQALANGDTKGLDSIVKTAGLLESLGMFGGEEAKTKELTSAQQTRAAAAQNALNDIPMIEEAITSGKLGGLKNLPGSGTQWGRRLLGTEDLDAALFNIADNILRARSGAAAPEAEVQRFKNTFLPRESDSENAKRLKLERAIRELQGYVNPQGAASGGIEDSLLGLQEQL